jgi:hypothetical protein
MFKTIRQTRAFIRVNAVMILVFWGCCHVELAAADSAPSMQQSLTLKMGNKV